MPTCRLPTLAGVSIRATGRSRVSSDRRGTVVSYTGHLIINGRQVLSPEQIRAEWTTRGAAAMHEADRTEHSDPYGHAWAKGVAGAYSTAVALLNAWCTELGAVGLPLTDVVAGIKVTRAAMLEQTPTDTGEANRLSLSAAASMLLHLADDLAVTASYTWEGAS
ncbi:hypothetical protein [Salinispora arenicola]|uniref:hypothetical protein n=1 Tax=Salinispora arenicola TaxID=168697 RepID=UPI0016A3E286|nr:hypothetical protein [Salinispora arenicola]NIL56223.1 hypothetical protein [Salinispora arenicola]NIL62146.1 hypothetical protein [Salinispora arenicola]